MKIAWVGLIFHAAMILWLREKGMPMFIKSRPCKKFTEPSRLLIVIFPGLTAEHADVFADFGRGIAGSVIASPGCPAVYSYFAGVSASPVLPESLDTVFEHVHLTVYSGRKEFTLKKKFLKLRMPMYFRERHLKKNERAELDGVASLLGNRTYMESAFAPFVQANATIFLVHLGGLTDSNATADIVRGLQIDVNHLARSIDYTFDDERTNVLLISENGGPYSVWGPDVAHSGSARELRAPDVAPLIAALLGVAVPFGSVGCLRPAFISNDKKRADAVHCSALQLDALLNETAQGPHMADLQHNSTNVIRLIKELTGIGFCKQAVSYGTKLNHLLHKLYHKAKMRLDTILLGLIVAMIVAWTSALVVELTLISYPSSSKSTLLFVLTHVAFFALACGAVTLPIWMKWPYTYHIYTTCPILFCWMAFSRIEVLAYFFRATPWKELAVYLGYILFTGLLAEYSLRASELDKLSLIVGLCVLVHYPALPRFFVSPFLAKVGWWLVCFLHLGCLYLPNWAERQPKLYNFSGTVMICASGFSSFWLQPLRDSSLSVLITLFTAAAMLIQSLSRAPQYLHQLKYLTIPMMFIPFLTVVGKNRVKNRIFHSVFSTGVLVMLTSTRMEPLCYFLAMISSGLWTLMENFRLSDRLGTDEMRRAVFLAVVAHTTTAITRTLPEAYLHLDAPHLIPLFDLYRLTMILTCIMTIYLSMIPSKPHTYSSFIIVLLSNALASLRAVVTGVDSARLHYHGVAFVLSFYVGRLLSAPGSKNLPDDEPGPRPDPLPEPDLIPNNAERVPST